VNTKKEREIELNYMLAQISSIIHDFIFQFIFYLAAILAVEVAGK
jgi:hypothetical protein